MQCHTFCQSPPKDRDLDRAVKVVSKAIVVNLKDLLSAVTLRSASAHFSMSESR